ncbi:MAG: MATE family efflux transporter [Clostridiales bacterium]|nr:MATE family efflux transporter [Clostridiales bacterium]
MTQGNLWTGILLFALPLAATGILQQFFNAADIAIVGKYTGEQGELAMAAVGANSPLVGIVTNLFVGIALGTNVVIANSIGRGDGKSINRAVHTSILIALFGGLIFSLIAQAYAVPILSSQNVPEEVLPYAVLYFRIYMLGLPVILLYNFEAAILRGMGNTTTPLLTLFLSGALNVLLNLFFVLRLKRTVDGVAIATVASNGVSALVLLIYLMKKDTPARVRLSDLRIDTPTLGKIMKIGIPAGIQSTVFGIANIIIQSSINSLGPLVMASSSAAFNIELFAYYVLNSFSQACTSFTGQNYGAGKIDRCKKVIRLSMIEGIIAMAVAIAVILFFGKDILHVFNDSPDIINVAYERLMIIFSAYIFTLSYEVISGYLRGFGISLIPAILTTVGICGVRLSWIFLVFNNHKTFNTIMLAYPLSLSATALILFVALLMIRPSRKAENEKKRALSKAGNYPEDQ